MKVNNFIKSLKYHSSLGFALVLITYKIYVFFKYRLRSDQYYISRSFKKTFKRELDLTKPETLNEKIQWYKLNYKNPLIEQCADKYEVRKYVAETIGNQYLIPLVFHTKDYTEVKSENLPDYPVVIKANHTSGTTHFVKDKSNVDWHVIRTDCRWWLHLNYSFMQKEWQYNAIKPRIVIEKLLTDENDQIPSDYKLHFFNGEFGFIQLDLDRFTAYKRNLYDQDWNLLPFNWSTLNSNNEPICVNGEEIEPPNNLKILIELGKKLAQPFPYVRVDFYNLNGEIYFGELTFSNEGGYAHFIPNHWDLYYGKKVPLIIDY